MINAITQAMIHILKLIDGVTHDMGLTLVVFAAFVKILTAGPTQKMLKSQRDMARIKPHLAELEKLHKGDPVKKQQETMRVMKEHNVEPPLIGCLLMLVQMPILFGIFRAITSSPEAFQSAYFLWVHPGTLQSWAPSYFASCLADRDLPLVLIYGLMMLLSQTTSPTQADPTQRTMGLYMSIFITYTGWKMKWPCALVLYWSTYQFITILHQMYFNAYLDRMPIYQPKPTPIVAPAP
jgi:YidC/Oxa1 family membrane protein insertase